MQTTTLENASPRDQALDWTMRFAGLVLAGGSVFFLWKNFGYGIGDDVFFSLSAMLGVFTLALSWLPYRR